MQNIKFTSTLIFKSKTQVNMHSAGIFCSEEALVLRDAFATPVNFEIRIHTKVEVLRVS